MSATMLGCRGHIFFAFTSRFMRNLAYVRHCSVALNEEISLLPRCEQAFPAAGSYSRHLCTHNEATSADMVEEEDALYKKLIVEVRGHDPEVLKSYETYVTTAARLLDLSMESVETPPKHIHKMTLLKSVHIYKKHRVQYEMRTHFKIFNIKNLTGSTADTFLEYIQRNLPEGISMKVTKHRIEQLPDHLRPPVKEPELAT